MILQFYCITFLLLPMHCLIDGLGFSPPPPIFFFLNLLSPFFFFFGLGFLQCYIYKYVRVVKEKLYL